MKDQTFVFEADAFRSVTYRQTLRLAVEARTEDEANEALESAVSNCGWGDEPESIVEIHVVRDGRTILEAFEIHGAGDHPDTDDWPEEEHAWEVDGVEPHTGFEEQEEARKDQGKCKELNPELYTEVQV
jgi:hypothetical protein